MLPTDENSISERNLKIYGKRTCINKGTNEWSWKYNSILSPSVSRAVREKRYGPSILPVTSNGVRMECFSFALAL